MLTAEHPRIEAELVDGRTVVSRQPADGDRFFYIVAADKEFDSGSPGKPIAATSENDTLEPPITLNRDANALAITMSGGGFEAESVVVTASEIDLVAGEAFPSPDGSSLLVSRFDWNYNRTWITVDLQSGETRSLSGITNEAWGVYWFGDGLLIESGSSGERSMVKLRYIERKDLGS